MEGGESRRKRRIRHNRRRRKRRIRQNRSRRKRRIGQKLKKESVIKRNKEEKRKKGVGDSEVGGEQVKEVKKKGVLREEKKNE